MIYRAVTSRRNAAVGGGDATSGEAASRRRVVPRGRRDGGGGDATGGEAASRGKKGKRPQIKRRGYMRWVKQATVTKELHLGQKYFFYGVLRFGLVPRFFMGLSEVLCEKGG